MNGGGRRMAMDDGWRWTMNGSGRMDGSERRRLVDMVKGGERTTNNSYPHKSRSSLLLPRQQASRPAQRQRTSEPERLRAAGEVREDVRDEGDDLSRG